MVGLGDVHDHRRSGSLQLGHLRTLERLVRWSTPTGKVPLHWNGTSPPDEYADFTKEYGLHHERITLPTTFNAKKTLPTLYLLAARMLPMLVRRIAFRAARKRIHR